MKALANLFALPFLAMAISHADAQTLAQPNANGNGNTVMCATVNSALSVNGVALGATAKCFSLPDATAQAFVGYAIAQAPQIDTGTKDSNGNEIYRAETPSEALAWFGANMEAGILGDVANWAKQQAAAQAAANAAPPSPTPAQ